MDCPFLFGKSVWHLTGSPHPTLNILGVK